MKTLAIITNLRSRLGNESRLLIFDTALLILERFLYSNAEKTRGAPFVRATSSVQGIYNNFVIASLPCWLIGLWNLGYQSNLAMQSMQVETLPGWRGIFLGVLNLGIDPGNVFACFLLGLLYFLPLFFIVLLITTFWESLFATMRQRAPTEGLLAFAWLYTLFLPAGAPLFPLALGASFGLIFGKHIFGGTGFYLINPVVVALVFLWIAYPATVFGADSLIPLIPGETLQSIDPAQDWWDAFIGVRVGAMGITSVLGCTLGAGYLLVAGSASWRILLGSLFGIALALLIHDIVSAGAAELNFGQQIVSGGLAFAIVFLATDPVSSSMTNGGRWLYGGTLGALTILIGVANSSVGESVLFAIFITSLMAPLFDSAVIAAYKARRQRRIERVSDG